MKPIEIAYSKSTFDQKRLYEAGGSIVFDGRGMPRFQFKSRQQYDKYRELNNRRGVAQ